MKTPPSASGASGDAPSNASSEKPAALDDSNIGGALRSVYQQTIDEDIPAEMLDLLNKLA